jgi:hypothetical protein
MWNGNDEKYSIDSEVIFCQLQGKHILCKKSTCVAVKNICESKKVKVKLHWSIIEKVWWKVPQTLDLGIKLRQEVKFMIWLIYPWGNWP